jgi:hypothetical protein
MEILEWKKGQSHFTFETHTKSFSNHSFLFAAWRCAKPLLESRYIVLRRYALTISATSPFYHGAGQTPSGFQPWTLYPLGRSQAEPAGTASI